ncbi:AAA family ATPase [Acinetobacter sp. ANC 4641]|uniref:AAA family ATPase n=1 Tax=Acinetobacter sp. ANC 4641 TaxID=2529847 RepID=UPI00103A891A|nr:SbcC/MukB-like Walker B domain-containing protein [Acinetobacter sp. ANC 4641]TCB08831.1 ATP-dependent dsDNA exonuclease [Acinetobacter sp. ANC 4641]
MKILSIRIKNLASLAGEQWIDFESQPLANAGLIAITGKTGAGKSTILDAMCLALFNKIPRLKESDGKLRDVDGSELLSNSPLTVLRRGAGHGFAEVSFIAPDQKRYLARWELKRARENPTGKLQSVQRSLTCLSDGVVIADKTKAVDDSIKNITQLSFEQFTRAVLLAQSEVTAFLKARDSERGELLEYLTNSSIFAKIGQLAYEKTKVLTTQRKELESFSGRIEILSDEAVAELTEQLQQSNMQYEKLNAEKIKLEQHQHWFTQQQKLEHDVQQRQQHQTEQQQKFDALGSKRTQLKQLETFASIRPSVIQQQKTQAELHQLQPKIQSSQLQFNAIKHDFEQEKTVFENVDKQFKAQHTFEQTHQSSLEQVRVYIQEREFIGKQFVKAKSTLEHLQQDLQPLLQQQSQLQTDCDQFSTQLEQQSQQLKQTAQFSSLDQGLSAHIAPLQRFIQHFQNFEQQYGELATAQTDLSQKQQQLALQQQQFGHEQNIDAQLREFRSQHEKILAQSHQLTLINTQFQQFNQLRLEQNAVQTKCDELTQEIEQSSQQVQHTEQQYQTQKLEREHLQRILQQQRLLHTENIEKLREQLIEGETCLVCGSTHHPFKAEHSSLSNELLKLQEQQEQQVLQLEQQQLQAWQQAQQIHVQHNMALTQNQSRLNALTADLEKTQQSMSHACTQAQIDIDFSQSPERTQQQLLQNIQTLQQDKQNLEQSIQQLDDAQKQQRALTQQIQEISQQLSIVQQSEQTIQYLLDLLTTEQRDAWQKQTMHVANQIVQQLNQRSQLLRHIEILNQQLNDKTQLLQQKTLELQHKQALIQQAETEQAELKRKGKENTDSAIQLIFAMMHIQIEKPHEWLIQYDAQRQNLQLQFNQIRQSFEQTREKFDQQQRQLDQLNIQLLQVTAQHQTATLEIEQWLKQHTEFDQPLLSQLQHISLEETQQIRRHVQDAERALADAQAALKAIQEQLQQHLTHQPEMGLAELQTEFTALLESLQQTQDMRDNFKLKLELHQRNLENRQEFLEQIQQIQQQEHRWGKISGLMGDANGKKFRDLAQQYNLDILLEYANQQLAMLSQRYTLKRLDHSLSLAIIDHDMDGEVRSVASLSGGESFLTALALSLAIANMASGSMKIESLFIDEGFGTLDASSLHMVMNALDQLQNQGRKVVLISHIQDMHERIPVQIQVQPLGSGASQIEIVG